ncbi:hypothetical protein ACHAW5_000428 [Stephanodiscus triporus]|uniref:Secreted protein n=1 Tax=Stephanodiscus triporus TaxID=2934178 RepID=A0ABD3Q3C3_9STRA
MAAMLCPSSVLSQFYYLHNIVVLILFICPTTSSVRCVGSSALCMSDFSLGPSDLNLNEPTDRQDPKMLPASTHAGRNVIPKTTTTIAPPSIDWNRLAAHVLCGSTRCCHLQDDLGHHQWCSLHN